MKSYRFFFLILVLILIVSSSAYAEDLEKEEYQGEKVIFSAEEITDFDSLLERAKNGITDIRNNNVSNFSLEAESINGIENKNINEEVVNIDEYSTTQKIRAVQKGEDIVETYTTSNFGIMAVGSKSESQSDSSFGVTAHSKFTYDRIVSSNITYYKLISVEGSWVRSDSTITLSNRLVSYGASGNLLNGGFYSPQRSMNNSVSGNTFSFNANSAWDYVAGNGIFMGVTTNVTLTRGSSTWKLDFTNNV